jgi:hypothetical protein
MAARDLLSRSPAAAKLPHDPSTQPGRSRDQASSDNDDLVGHGHGLVIWRSAMQVCWEPRADRAARGGEGASHAVSPSAARAPMPRRTPPAPEAETDFCFTPPAQLPRHLIRHEQHANDKPRGVCPRDMAFGGPAWSGLPPEMPQFLVERWMTRPARRASGCLDAYRARRHPPRLELEANFKGFDKESGREPRRIGPPKLRAAVCRIWRGTVRRREPAAAAAAAARSCLRSHDFEAGKPRSTEPDTLPCQHTHGAMSWAPCESLVGLWGLQVGVSCPLGTCVNFAVSIFACSARRLRPRAYLVLPLLVHVF